MTEPTSMGPIDALSGTGAAVHTPKAGQLVARTLRRMIVDGHLTDGDFLPHEAELMEHFGVSRPTLREAVRVLESERLVEVRRGSRTGARVCVPGAEIVARPAGLLLEVSGTSVADVLAARAVIEPGAAALLAERKDAAAIDELEAIIENQIPESYAANTLGTTTTNLHLRLVELSGNDTLGMIAGMIHEIIERHTSSAILNQPIPDAQYQRLMRSYRHLITLLRAGDALEASAHWRRHLQNANKALLTGREDTMVRDVID